MSIDVTLRTTIRRFQSCNPDPREAVREFHAGVAQPDMAFVLFFCSSAYDLDAVAEEMRRQFAGVQVFGCTTSGEFGPAGYREHGLAGASFPAASFTANGQLLQNLQAFDPSAAEAGARAQLQRLGGAAPQSSPENTLALLFIDGLSVREEAVAGALQNALGGIPLIGGSAGDGANFRRTRVYCGDRFYNDAAVMVFLTTALPLRTFNIQHFEPVGEQLVVTEADAAHRLVREINGLPAAAEYARIVNVAPQDLQLSHFALSPVLVQIGGKNYVRSIQRVNPDGSLTFYCAIEEGIVLRVARGGDLVANLAEAFAQIQREIGVPAFTLGFDCILRKVEIEQKGLADRVAEIFERNNAVGFNTYGEQYKGIHVNQTLTGIAIGRAEGKHV